MLIALDDRFLYVFKKAGHFFGVNEKVSEMELKKRLIKVNKKNKSNNFISKITKVHLNIIA